jgi:type I restriction enzyme S subunit
VKKSRCLSLPKAAAKKSLSKETAQAKTKKQKPMSKNSENKLIPRLRFPEFQHSGEWGYFNGDKLFEPIVNKNHNSDLPILAITQEHGAIPRNMIDYHVSVTDSSIKSYKVVEVGDFIIRSCLTFSDKKHRNFHFIVPEGYLSHILHQKQLLWKSCHRRVLRRTFYPC